MQLLQNVTAIIKQKFPTKRSRPFTVTSVVKMQFFKNLNLSAEILCLTMAPNPVKLCLVCLKSYRISSDNLRFKGVEFSHS